MALSQSSLSVLSAVTTTQTSSAQSLGDIQSLYVSIVVVGTPTVAPQFIPQYSPDGGTTYYNGPTYTTPLVAGTYHYIVNIPSDATHAKVAFTQQTGGTSSTLTAQISKKTFP